jgi:[FeFe] hydrogenase H-cluster maturation GTPase HydF
VKRAPRGIRLVIALVGRRNSGKSSLINAITGQSIAIVSDQPGTTTDPVAKHFELLPVGPVTFYDTAGIDDTGELGKMRVRATRKVLYRADLAVVVVDGNGITESDRQTLDMIRDLDIPFILVFNKVDLNEPSETDLAYCRTQNIQSVTVSAKTKTGIQNLRDVIITNAPSEMTDEPLLVGDLIKEGDTVLLVVPIDLAAPKGRLILPQVQVIREILDSDAIAMVVKDREIDEALTNLTHDPALVITDSQVILKVAGDVNEDIPLTTFSILFARFKGEFSSLVEGARAIDTLRDGDKVLIGEACSHHIQADDIGRVKIPRWITQYTGKDLEFVVYSGHDFPEDVEVYSLVVHCGACMLNRMEMMRRTKECLRRGIPITNYGMAISKVQGTLERVIRPFYQ